MVKVDRHIAATGLEIADHRHPLADRFKVVNAQGYTGRTSNCQQVQYGICRATHRHDHAYSVLEGLTSKQIAGADICLKGLNQNLGATRSIVGFFRVFGSHGGAIGEAQPHHLKGGAHRVGCEHATAAARAWAGILLNSSELLLINTPTAILPDSFKCTNNSEVTGTELARLDCASIYKDGWDIHACHGQHGTRHVFVTAANCQQAIHALGVTGSFN